jgi:hypothetical protein
MSTGTVYQQGQFVACPHCQQNQDTPVEDQVIPGFVGADSRYTTDCEWCFEDFTVEAQADGSFVVNAA